MSTPQISETTAAQKTWIVGGSLLLATVVLDQALRAGISPIPRAGLASTVLFSVALLIFAFGLRGGSVTARRPLGTAALIILALWTLLVPMLQNLFVSPVDDPAFALTWGYIETVVRFLLALVAVIQIARAGVVPAPWRWAPTWVLIAVAVSWAIQQITVAVLSRDAASILGGLITVDILVRVGGTVFLGAVAIGVSGRVSRPQTVETHELSEAELSEAELS